MADVLRIYLGFARDNPRYFRIIFKESTPEMIRNIPVEFRKRLEEHERACLGVAVAVAQKAKDEGLIGGDIEPWEVAATFWGAATGIILLSMGGSQTVFGDTTREELVEKAVWLLFAGLQTTASNGGS
jgi:hypothetical protein